jgi:Uma2 family endonuclease
MDGTDPRGHVTSMGRPARLPYYTYDEYRRFERDSNVKHEFLDGQILAMAGGTLEHAALAAAICTLLGQSLENGPCHWFGSDLRIRVVATGLATYPDVTVICGDVERDPDDRNNAVNPTVLIEVSSPSTEHYDRGAKAEHYRRIPSLREYVLVSQRERRIERWRPDESDGWQAETAERGGRIDLEAIGVVLDVDAVYERSSLTRDL